MHIHYNLNSDFNYIAVAESQKVPKRLERQSLEVKPRSPHSLPCMCTIFRGVKIPSMCAIFLTDPNNKDTEGESTAQSTEGRAVWVTH